MRTENINVKLTISFPINQPDKNGTIYTNEAVKKAIMNLDATLPILFCDNKQNAIVIGNTNGWTAGWNHKKGTYELFIDGNIYYGGTSCIVNEIQGNVVKDFRIASIEIGV